MTNEYLTQLQDEWLADRYDIDDAVYNASVKMTHLNFMFRSSQTPNPKRWITITRHGLEDKCADFVAVGTDRIIKASFGFSAPLTRDAILYVLNEKPTWFD